jgi:hypothetical protein
MIRSVEGSTGFFGWLLSGGQRFFRLFPKETVPMAMGVATGAGVRDLFPYESGVLFDQF